MARSQRYSKLGYCHHVIYRGHRKNCIFRSDHDRTCLINLLQWMSKKHQCYVHGFCFMSNHIHLILEPTLNHLSDCVHDLSSCYAQYFNKRYDLTGCLFEGRFKSFVVEDGQYLKTLIRYVHLNPYKAKLVSRPSEYKWSSHRAYLGLESYPWLIKERILKAFDYDLSCAHHSYQKFIRNVAAAEKEVNFINICSDYGVMGSQHFIKEVAGIDTMKEMLFRIATDTLSLEDIIARTCNYFSISFDELISSNRRKKECMIARCALAWIGRHAPNFTLEIVGKHINCSASTLSRLVKAASQNQKVQRFVMKI